MGKPIRNKSRKARASNGAHGKKSRGPVLSVPAAYNTPTWKGKETSMEVDGEEMWVSNVASASVGTVSTDFFLPGKSGMPLLDQYGAMFDLYRIVSCKIMYKPACGTQTAGRVVAAIDYDAATQPASSADVDVITPQVRPQLFQPAEMPVDVNKANKAMWLRTFDGVTALSAFAVSFYATTSAPTTSVGEIWCRYRIRFTNPKRPATGLISTMVTSGSNMKYIYYLSSGNKPIQTTDGGTILIPTGIPSKIFFHYGYLQWIVQRVGQFITEFNGFGTLVNKQAFIDAVYQLFKPHLEAGRMKIFTPANTGGDADGTWQFWTWLSPLMAQYLPLLFPSTSVIGTTGWPNAVWANYLQQFDSLIFNLNGTPTEYLQGLIDAGHAQSLGDYVAAMPPRPYNADDSDAESTIMVTRTSTRKR